MIDKGRVEAFSDGVIAVAITLLVLDLRVPEPSGDPGRLGSELLALWPNALAYVISFVAIGILWINHHTMLRRLIGVDHAIVVLNLILMLCIVLLPFSTSLLANYLDEPAGGRIAALVYAASFLATSLVFTAMQLRLLLRRPDLFDVPPSRAQRRTALIRASVAAPAYLTAGLLGLVSPYLTLSVCVVLGIAYLLPPPSSTGGAADDALP